MTILRPSLACLAVVLSSGCSSSESASDTGPAGAIGQVEAGTDAAVDGAQDAGAQDAAITPDAASALFATLETSKGKIVIELASTSAPGTVDNFVRYARDGFFDGLIFHRVIPGFMIQGGG